jgi:hypothetical protein
VTEPNDVNLARIPGLLGAALKRAAGDPGFAQILEATLDHLLRNGVTLAQLSSDRLIIPAGVHYLHQLPEVVLRMPLVTSYSNVSQVTVFPGAKTVADLYDWPIERLSANGFRIEAIRRIQEAVAMYHHSLQLYSTEGVAPPGNHWHWITQTWPILHTRLMQLPPADLRPVLDDMQYMFFAPTVRDLTQLTATQVCERAHIGEPRVAAIERLLHHLGLAFAPESTTA